MTASQSHEILKRLERIEQDLGVIKTELAETRGAFRLAKFVIALFGMTGLAGVLAYFQGQPK